MMAQENYAGNTALITSKDLIFCWQEAADQYYEKSLDQLGKEGMIQRFEVCMELAWKTMKDYLEYQNVVFSQVTPRAVIKEGFAAKLIDDGEGWMNALDARNRMSHTYDFNKFEVVLQQVSEKYLKCFGQLYEKLALEYDTMDDA